MRTDEPQHPEAREALVRAMSELDLLTEPNTVDDHLELIRSAAALEAEAHTILKHSVGAARSAGATWTAVGRTLGISKQAAQKRFATEDVPDADGLGADERIIGPVTAFDEMAELGLAGQYGWHSVAFGPYYHRVVHSDTQWEHVRVLMTPTKTRKLEADGWQLIGSWFPYAYLKRDLKSPARIEAD